MFAVGYGNKMSVKTATATMGRYQTRGNDFLHLVDEQGQMKARIDAEGYHYCSDVITTSGLSLASLQAQIISGVPSVVDTGTF